MKLNNKKLLEFYRELVYSQNLSEDYTIKKYGAFINSHLKIVCRSMNSPASYNKDTRKYVANTYFLFPEIDRLENKNSIEEQKHTNKVMAYAIILQACILAIQFLTKLTDFLSNMKMWQFMILIISIITLIFLYRLFKEAFRL